MWCVKSYVLAMLVGVWGGGGGFGLRLHEAHGVISNKTRKLHMERSLIEAYRSGIEWGVVEMLHQGGLPDSGGFS